MAQITLPDARHRYRHRSIDGGANGFDLRGARNVTCVCPLDPVPCKFVGYGSIVCKRCERPPLESLGIEWTADLLAAVQARPDLMPTVRTDLHTQPERQHQ